MGVSWAFTSSRWGAWRAFRGQKRAWDFAQVFTGALWWLLLGGQTGGRRDCSSRKEGVGGCWGPARAEAMRGNFQGSEGCEGVVDEVGFQSGGGI